MKLLVLDQNEISWITLPTKDINNHLKIIDCESQYQIIESLSLHATIDELNELSILINELSKDDQLKLKLILESTQYVENIKDLMNLIINLEEFEIIKGITNFYDLGKYYSDSYSFIKDYEKLGKEIYTIENGIFTNDYYIACLNPTCFERYQ